jgi:hypothetical protein
VAAAIASCKSVGSFPRVNVTVFMCLPSGMRNISVRVSYVSGLDDDNDDMLDKRLDVVQ